MPSKCHKIIDQSSKTRYFDAKIYHSAKSISDNTQNELKEQIDIHTLLINKLQRKLLEKQKKKIEYLKMKANQNNNSPQSKISMSFANQDNRSN